jgi:hypothetical protein
MVKIPGRGSAKTPDSTQTTRATSATPAEQPTPNRFKQIVMVAGIVRKHDPRALPIVIGGGIGVIVVFVVVGLLTNLASYLIPLGTRRSKDSRAPRPRSCSRCAATGASRRRSPGTGIWTSFTGSSAAPA